jgi:hypothetical protein
LSAGDFGEDVGGFGCPDERFWGGVLGGDVGGDGLLESGDAVEDAVPEAAGGQVVESANIAVSRWRDVKKCGDRAAQIKRDMKLYRRVGAGPVGHG